MTQMSYLSIFYELQVPFCCLQVDLFILFNVGTTEVFSSLCSN